MSFVVSVFGAHTPKPGGEDYERARELGERLARAGFSVATGGYDGTMAAVSEGAASANGRVIAVTSSQIEKYRGAKVNPWVSQVFNYETLLDRLTHLVTENDAMVVLPGGIGTLAEMALAWNLIQVGVNVNRPLILMGSLWRETMNAFVRPNFVEQRDLGRIRMVDSPEQAVDLIQEILVVE